GVLGFVFSGLSASGLPPFSIGYVNGPAFAAMAVMAGVAAPLGARLAHRVDASALSKLFGAYVFLAAVGLIVDVYFD
ncbi:MAG: sulfite exporter TauE/SafE family protein, partial [Hyphococcus sp.]